MMIFVVGIFVLALVVGIFPVGNRYMKMHPAHVCLAIASDPTSRFL